MGQVIVTKATWKEAAPEQKSTSIEGLAAPRAGPPSSFSVIYLGGQMRTWRIFQL